MLAVLADQQEIQVLKEIQAILDLTVLVVLEDQANPFLHHQMEVTVD